MKSYNLRPYPYPGRFEDGLVIDEYLHELTLQGYLDEEAGSVAECGLWAGLVRAPLVAEDVGKHTLTHDEVQFLKAQAGAIIKENDQGFVWIEYYSDPTDLEEAWEELVNDLTFKE